MLARNSGPHDKMHADENWVAVWCQCWSLVLQMIVAVIIGVVASFWVACCLISWVTLWFVIVFRKVKLTCSVLFAPHKIQYAFVWAENHSE